MTRVILRLFVVLAMLDSPAMASSMAMPFMDRAHQTAIRLIHEGSPERCLLASSACSICQTCLADVSDLANGTEVVHRDVWPSASADLLAGIPSSPEPIPP